MSKTEEVLRKRRVSSILKNTPLHQRTLSELEEQVMEQETVFEFHRNRYNRYLSNKQLHKDHNNMDYKLAQEAQKAADKLWKRIHLMSKIQLPFTGS